MKNKILFLLFVMLALSACNKQTSEAPGETATNKNIPAVNEETKLDADAAEAWWATGGEVLAHSLLNARKLQHLASDFLDEPDAEKLAATQQAWKNTAESYSAFYAHHYVALSEPQIFHLLAEIDFRIAAWPIQPGSLDSFGSYLYSGLVHDVGNPLTMENLLNLHGQIDSENATLGIFAIEYMLFGENSTRTVDDYVSQIKVTPEFKERGFNSTSELPNNRRRMLLTLQTGKLVEDLALLVNSWSSPGPASQLEAWNKLTNTNKSEVINAALEQGLAQLLVNEDDEKNSQHLLLALESLKPLPPLIKHVNTEKMDEEFAALATLLNSTENDPALAIDWSAVTNHLNTLSKLFAPTAPGPSEAEEISGDI